MRRDGFKCCLCGRKANSGVELQVDHKIPFSRGGACKDDNLWTLCQPCNSGKSDSPIPSWKSGHPKGKYNITVFMENGEPLDEEITWFDLPDDNELDDSKIMDFDRYVLSEFNLIRFMRRLSKWDLPQLDTPQAQAIKSEFKQRNIYAVIINRTEHLGMRTKVFLPGVLPAELEPRRREPQGFQYRRHTSFS
jgi:hypothetical protein